MFKILGRTVLKHNPHPSICNAFVRNFKTSHLRRNEYVQWVRKLQILKSDDQTCSKLYSSGKYLIFSKSRPLLEPYSGEPHDCFLERADFCASVLKKSGIWSSAPPFQICWLSFEIVQNLFEDICDLSVLLDVTKSGLSRYALQAGDVNEESLKILESSRIGSCFQDSRLSLFTVSRTESALLASASSHLAFHRANMYCGFCGSKTQRNVSGSQRACRTCKKELYPNSVPVGIVLVCDESHENALLVRQHRHPPNMYTCVAGYADAGETIESCVRREVAEEVGVEVTSIEYLGSQQWPFPNSLMVGCLATVPYQKVDPDPKELQDARWFTRSEVREAINRCSTDPMSWISNSSDTIVVPPPSTIAHCIMKTWLYRSDC